MYNEDEYDFKKSITGIIENYNYLISDKELSFTKKDVLVFLICDGLEKLPDSFLKYAKEKEFFDEELLKEKNFME